MSVLKIKNENGKWTDIPSLKGPDGKSAYQIWLNLGNTGTEQEFLNSLKGLDGTDGKDGVDGDTPVKGVDYWNEADKEEVKGFVDDSVADLENVLQDILNAIQTGVSAPMIIEDIEQLIVSYFENKTVGEVEE